MRRGLKHDIQIAPMLPKNCWKLFPDEKGIETHLPVPSERGFDPDAGNCSPMRRGLKQSWVGLPTISAIAWRWKLFPDEKGIEFWTLTCTAASLFPFGKCFSESPPGAWERSAAAKPAIGVTTGSGPVSPSLTASAGSNCEPFRDFIELSLSQRRDVDHLAGSGSQPRLHRQLPIGQALCAQAAWKPIPEARAVIQTAPGEDR